MEKYTTKQLAELAGTSVRTLHYYEEVDLLHPKRMPNGYRSYGPADVERLRQILAMRACRMPLAEIRQLLDGSDTDAVGLLARHLEELRAQERQVKEAIARTRAAMELLEGVSRMGTKEGFEELKQRRLEEFESSYGNEARKRYGTDVIDQTNERLMDLSQEEWNEKDRIEKRIIELLAEAKADGDPRGPKAQELCLPAPPALDQDPLGRGELQHRGALRTGQALPRRPALHRLLRRCSGDGGDGVPRRRTRGQPLGLTAAREVPLRLSACQKNCALDFFQANATWANVRHLHNSELPCAIFFA